MDKNTLVFLIIVLAVVSVVGFLFWKSYASQKAETNKYDAISAWADSAGGVGQSFMDNYFGIFKGGKQS